MTNERKRQIMTLAGIVGGGMGGGVFGSIAGSKLAGAGVGALAGGLGGAYGSKDAYPDPSVDKNWDKWTGERWDSQGDIEYLRNIIAQTAESFKNNKPWGIPDKTWNESYLDAYSEILETASKKQGAPKVNELQEFLRAKDMTEPSQRKNSRAALDDMFSQPRAVESGFGPSRPREVEHGIVGRRATWDEIEKHGRH